LNPQSLRDVAAKLSDEFSLDISKCMLKKYIKKQLRYSWKRMRKWLKPFQKPEDYAKLFEELKALLLLEDEGKLKVFFADESGFSLVPTVPYGWSEINKTICILSKRSKRINVFGLYSRNNEFKSYQGEGSITAEQVVTYLDDFAKNITEKTVVVMDNATVHKAKIVKDKIKEWEELGLILWYLPAYSPHLNLIETLWRKIKCEWLKPHDYANIETLTKAIDDILENVGKSFKISFKKEAFI